jgi:ATP-binding cassette subfamily F protein uup
MPIITGRQLSLSYGDTPLLSNVNFSIDPGQRIVLLGRNGTGKSTFLKILMGQVMPDHGEVIRQTGVTLALLSQAVPAAQEKTILEIVSEGTRLKDLDPDWDAKLYGQIQSQMDALLSQMNLNPQDAFHQLSGGMKRRVLLAQAIISSPDLLILDEPTNHLDLPSIEWLEGFLSTYRKAILIVSHDRTFVEKMATHVFELDRGTLSTFSGGYSAYLVHKQEALHAEEKAWERFDKKLAEEEIWIRQGIKARRTRNEGRVVALEQMRRERAERHARVGKPDFKLAEESRSGKKVIEAHHLGLSFGENRLIDDLSLTVHKGDKIGIIGANGVGKSTLIHLLLKEKTPDTGTVTLGAGVEVAYLNQLRQGVDPESTVFEAISEGGKEFITQGGVNKHIYSYLQDFLFTPARARAKVKVLSGGELNRLLLAKLFTKPANLLVLDEPTNDLDLETLELLEELIIDYAGTLLLVSHDRTFLNHIVTSTLVSEGNGKWTEYLGGYDDYLRQSSLLKAEKVSQKNTPISPSEPKSAPLSSPKKRKLSFSETKELAALPDRLADVEGKISALQATMASSDFYQKSPEEIISAQTELSTLESELERLFSRWELLEKPLHSSE